MPTQMTAAVPASVYRAIKVSGDWLPEDVSFDAYTDGTFWNGFETPEFTLEVGQAIAGVSPGLTYDAASDAFLFSDEENAPGEAPERFTGHTIVVNGQDVRVYGIGSWGWCWCEHG